MFCSVFAPLNGFQSTRPRGARRMVRDCATAERKVSIHAPARGATLGVTVFEGLGQVSIHAPARGATCRRQDHAYSNIVSIHAPARGATCPRIRMPSQRRCFNPRARAGRDPRRMHARAGSGGFNPRARAGRDPASKGGFMTMASFQSTRPRGARRLWWHKQRPIAKVSIHAPARGATRKPHRRRVRS